MASIKNLKKDINNVLGDIIEGVYVVDAANGNQHSKEGEAVIEEAFTTFDQLIAKVNQKGVENQKQHFKEVKKELEEKATQLVDSLNKIG